MAERTKAPKKGDKFYSTSNPFAGTKYDMFKNKGNCTHYAYGRMSEAMGKKSGLPTCNAENWIKKVSKTFKTGKTPKVESVIVYKHTKKSGGHVAFVERIKSNGDLVLTMSGWKTYIWKQKTVTKKLGYVYSDYKLLGFIYKK